MRVDVLPSALAEYFAPWVQALELEVEQFDTATYALLWLCGRPPRAELARRR